MYYHYTSFETFLRILQGIELEGKEPVLHLHATRIDKVNDPTEMSIKKSTLLKLIKHYEKNLSHDIRIADKIKDMSQSEINHIIKSEKGEHPPYIACFSKKRDYLPMWSLYGDKHHGVCLCFSDNIKYRIGVNNNDNANIIAGDVVYRRISESNSVNRALKLYYEIIAPNTNDEDIGNVLPDILAWISPFIKNSNYSYEREFRISVYNYKSEDDTLITYYDTEEKHIDLNIPVSGLKQIILGKKLPFDITRKLLQSYFEKNQHRVVIKSSRIPYQ